MLNTNVNKLMRQKKKVPKVSLDAMVYTDMDEYEGQMAGNAKLLKNFGRAMSTKNSTIRNSQKERSQKSNHPMLDQE